MSKKIDITGEKFGKLTAIKFFKRENNKTYWLFKCDCGKECFLNIHSVRTNQTRSCGCLKHSERPGAKGRVSPTKTHNMTGKRLYRIWQNMKNRCRNKNTISYKNYGGRGVCVCKDWSNDFLNFYNWSIFNGYKDDLSIDRIDNDGNYCPENCRWATKKQQARNTRKNRFIEYKGQKKCLAEWAEETNICQSTIAHRLKTGINIEMALKK